MSLTTHSPLVPDATMQRESEQNLSVSCLNCLPLAFADNYQIQDSGSSLFPNFPSILITGGTFTVSLSCGLYKQLIIVHILFVRTLLERGT